MRLYGAGDALLRDVSVDLQVAGHGWQSVPLASLFDDFIDMSFAYCFGPPPVGLVHARLLDENAVVQSEAFYQPAALLKVGEVGSGVDPRLSARFVHLIGRTGQHGLIVVVGLALCFALAFAAEAIGLAAIIGEFAAGVVLDPYGAGVRARDDEETLAELLRPLSAVFVPEILLLLKA